MINYQETIERLEADANSLIFAEKHNIAARIKDAITLLRHYREGLEFYANPDTYFAILFTGDRPCGEFADDLDCDYMDYTKIDYDHYHRPMPGKRARKTLEGRNERI